MKRIAALCAVLMVVPALVYASHHTSRPALAQALSPQSSFEGTRAWSKLGPTMQQAWLAAEKAGDMGRTFEAYVRVQSVGGGMGDENFLQSKGFNVRIMSGSTARGSVKASDLQDVAELPFVEAINLAGQ